MRLTAALRERVRKEGLLDRERPLHTLGCGQPEHAQRARPHALERACGPVVRVLRGARRVGVAGGGRETRQGRGDKEGKENMKGGAAR